MMFYIWKSVESAAGAGPIAGIWRDRMRVPKNRLVHRRDSEGSAIAQITMWRVHGKPKQQSAE